MIFESESDSQSGVSDSLRPHELPGFSVHGILQARILEWVAIPFSRGSSQTRDQPGLLPSRRILYYLSHQGMTIEPILYFLKP